MPVGRNEWFVACLVSTFLTKLKPSLKLFARGAGRTPKQAPRFRPKAIPPGMPFVSCPVSWLKTNRMVLKHVVFTIATCTV